MFTDSYLTHSFPKHHQPHKVSSKASCPGNHPQLNDILAYPSVEPVHSMDTERKNLQCDPSWSLHQRCISLPVLIASPQLPTLLIGSGTCVHWRSCYLYSHLQLCRTPISGRASRSQPKGEHAWQYGGEFRYHEISQAYTMAPEERQEWYPANTASSKASGKRVNTMLLLWPVDLAFHPFEWTGIPQKYMCSFYLWWWTYICYL